MNEIHADLLISNLDLVLNLYPLLNGKNISVFVEVNLTQDLAVYVERVVKDYYLRKRNKRVMFVKQYDHKGNLLPGVLTRHKANLVSYFRRLLHEEKIFICNQISTVSSMLENKYDNLDNGCTNFDILENMENGFVSRREENVMVGDPDVTDYFPTSEQIMKTTKELVQQATLFRCYSRNNQIFYSGKHQSKNLSCVDDMLMALILCIAWANLPKDTYVLS